MGELRERDLAEPNAVIARCDEPVIESRRSDVPNPNENPPR
jgi:hypothetical protein